MKKILYLSLFCNPMNAAEITPPPLPTEQCTLSMPLLTSLIERDPHVPTIKDRLGENYLHYACRTGNVSLVQLLLYHNFPIHEQDTFGRTPLYYALRGEYDAFQSGKPRGSAISLLLLEKGHNLSYCDPVYTPLMYAALFGLRDVTQKLLELGAQVNDLDRASGCTALMLAAQQNKVAVARLLMLYGAYPQIGDPAKSAFRNAIQWRDKGHPELLHVLQETKPNARLTLRENPLIFLARRELEPRRQNRLKHYKRLQQ